MTTAARWMLALLASLVLHAAAAGALPWVASRPEAHLGPLGSPPPAARGAGR